MLERFVIKPIAQNRAVGNFTQAATVMKVSSDSVEVAIQYGDDKILVLITLIDNVSTRHLQTEIQDDSRTTFLVAGGQNPADTMTRNAQPDDAAAASGGGGVGITPNVSDPAITAQNDHNVVPSVTVYDVVQYLGLGDVQLSDDQFMNRIWTAMQQLRSVAAERRWSPIGNEVISFGKYRNKPFHVIPVLHPGYCEYVLNNLGSRSTDGYKRFAAWLDMNFYAGDFEGL
jgi:hypothetical protein